MGLSGFFNLNLNLLGIHPYCSFHLPYYGKWILMMSAPLWVLICLCLAVWARSLTSKIAKWVAKVYVFMPVAGGCCCLPKRRRRQMDGSELAQSIRQFGLEATSASDDGLIVLSTGQGSSDAGSGDLARSRSDGLQEHDFQSHHGFDAGATVKIASGRFKGRRGTVSEQGGSTNGYLVNLGSQADGSQELIPTEHLDEVEKYGCLCTCKPRPTAKPKVRKPGFCSCTTKKICRLKCWLPWKIIGTIAGMLTGGLLAHMFSNAHAAAVLSLVGCTFLGYKWGRPAVPSTTHEIQSCEGEEFSFGDKQFATLGEPHSLVFSVKQGPESTATVALFCHFDIKHAVQYQVTLTETTMTISKGGSGHAVAVEVHSGRRWFWAQALEGELCVGVGKVVGTDPILRVKDINWVDAVTHCAVKSSEEGNQWFVHIDDEPPSSWRRLDVWGEFNYTSFRNRSIYVFLM